MIKNYQVRIPKSMVGVFREYIAEDEKVKYREKKGKFYLCYDNPPPIVRIFFRSVQVYAFLFAGLISFLDKMDSRQLKKIWRDRGIR